MGFMASVFSEVDLRDARVATEVWLEQFIGKMGLDYRPQSHIFDHLPAALRAIQNGEIEIMNLAALDYLDLHEASILEPYVVGVGFDGSRDNTYVLMVHAEAEIPSLQDLQGKCIRIDSRSRIAALWLDVLLLREGLPEGRTFFEDIMEVEKVSRAILPVFFKQADACIVTQHAFNTMVELNPQLGRVLKPLAQSRGLLKGLLCFTRALDPKDQDPIKKSVLKLHSGPEGQQVLMLFGLKQVVPFQPQYLNSTLKLKNEYKDLKLSGEQSP